MTPVAIYDGKIVASNLLKGNHIKPNYKGVPSVVFTIPPLASVGLQESVAKEQGLHFKTNFEKNTSGWYTSRRIGERYSGFKVLVEQRQENATPLMVMVMVIILMVAVSWVHTYWAHMLKKLSIFLR